MLTRNLAICLGITGLSSVLLFLYFKHRVNNVEEKLNAMFQLVQNHAQENLSPPVRVVQQPTETVYANQKKIEVSEDESESESESESDYSAEDDEDDTLRIENNNLEKSIQPDTISKEVSDVLEETIAKTAINNIKNQLSEVDVEIDNLEENDNAVNLSENDNDNDNNDITELEENQDENNEDEDEDEDSNNDVKKMTISPALMDYEAFKVPDLKSICQQRNLVGYSSLKKKDLVELLKNSDQEALGAE